MQNAKQKKSWTANKLENLNSHLNIKLCSMCSYPVSDLFKKKKAYIYSHDIMAFKLRSTLFSFLNVYKVEPTSSFQLRQRQENYMSQINAAENSVITKNPNVCRGRGAKYTVAPL